MIDTLTKPKRVLVTTQVYVDEVMIRDALITFAEQPDYISPLRIRSGEWARADGAGYFSEKFADAILSGRVVHVSEMSEDGGVEGVFLVTKDAVIKGLGLLAESSPDCFRDIRRGDVDAIAADLLMQQTLFREIRYG